MRSSPDDPAPASSVDGARPLPIERCPLCGGANDCAAARAGRFDVDCWCRTQSFPPALLATARTRSAAGCLCRGCASGAPAAPQGDAEASGPALPDALP